MKKTYLLTLLLLVFNLAGWSLSTEIAFAQSPVVHAVLFYSPSCGHCHQVINEDLPPLWEKYGDSLQIMGINVAAEEGQALYQAAIQAYQIPDDRRGVPTLIVGETVLVGSYEIPAMFPQIIEEGMAAGGIAWPEIPGLQEILAESEAESDPDRQAEAPTSEGANEPEPAPAAEVPESEEVPESASETNSTSPNLATREMEAGSLSIAERFAMDPTGNTLSVIVLGGMLVSVAVVLVRFRQNSVASTNLSHWVPVLVLVGLGVALYLAYVELTHTSAVCGPVGDCNTVQTSPFAYLFGVIPIGILGVLGYIAILAVWLAGRLGPARWKRPASLAVWGMALLGTVFSIYLTFLEPFVIGATCAWCLTSAVIMTLILWVTTPATRSGGRKRKSPTRGLAA